jgi:hypothetical protein
MTPSLAESGSPQHPSAKKVDSFGKNETPDNSAAKSSNTPSGSGVESQASNAQVESSSPEPDFFDEPLYPLRPGYTRRLIKKKYAPPEMWDVDFDEQEWMKKAYGEKVIIVDMDYVPDGWILVDGMSSQNNRG